MILRQLVSGLQMVGRLFLRPSAFQAPSLWVRVGVYPVITAVFVAIILSLTNVQTSHFVFGVSFSWLFGLLINVVMGGLLGATFALAFTVGERLAGVWVGALAGGMAVFSSMTTWVAGLLLVDPIYRLAAGPMLTKMSLLLLLMLVIGLTAVWWRPILFYPLQTAWNRLLYLLVQRRTQPRFWRWYTVFWDKLQFLPFFGLADYLVLVAESGGEEMWQGMNGRQQWAITSAQTERTARQLEVYIDVVDISQTHVWLPERSLNGSFWKSLHNISRGCRHGLDTGHTLPPPSYAAVFR